MGKLADEIAEAEAHLAILRRRALTATCAEVGHDWKLIGGANCGCDHDVGWCSLPVHECQRCKDCDYGENEEAEQIKTNCECGREIGL